MKAVQSFSIRADDPSSRHSLLRRIGRRWGPAARLVVQEFIANAAEHCRDHRVDLALHRDGIVAFDHGGGLLAPQSAKPEGEGGYGLTLIRAFGGCVTRWHEGMRLDYRFPHR